MKILLAIDGSPHSEFAEALMSVFPLPEPAEVIVVSVCPVPDLHHIGRDVSDAINEMVDQCREKARQMVEASGERIGSGARSVTTRLLDGHPGQELIATAEQEQVDLIVVGARGISGPHRLLLGSVSEKVVKYAPCAVLVTHEGEAPANPQIEKIVFACDGSPPVERAVERFAAMNWGASCQALLLHVLDKVGPFGTAPSNALDQERARQKDESDAHLQRLAEKLQASGIQTTTQTVIADRAADAIVAAAEEQQADLIVLGATGKSNWERLLLGSVSTRVLHQAPCSIWVERG